MGGVYQGLEGAKPPPMIILLGARGAKPPHAWKRFSILIPCRLRPIIVLAESIFYHPLFSPPPS